MSEHTWDDGHYSSDDVIESADGTGYTSVSDFVAGENGYEPDPAYVSETHPETGDA